MSSISNSYVWLRSPYVCLPKLVLKGLGMSSVRKKNPDHLLI